MGGKVERIGKKEENWSVRERKGRRRRVRVKLGKINL